MSGLKKTLVVPAPKNTVVRIMRATQRILGVNAGGGIDGHPYYDMQLTFSPSATRYYIQGTSIYSDPLPNVSEFSSLFDSWRLKKVVVRIDVPMGVSNSGLSPGFVLPQLLYAPDYNDSGSASRTDLLQYPQVLTHNFNRDGYTPLMFEFSPRSLTEVSSGIVSTSYINTPLNAWHRTSNMDVQHYGIKFYLDFFGLALNQSFPVEFTIWYDMEFTNPK